MTVFFTSDLHLGQDKPFIWEKRGYSNIAQHDKNLYKKWQNLISKRDVVYVLGDVAWKKKDLHWFGSWNGIKYLVRGNHDTLPDELYRLYFKKIYGAFKYTGKFNGKRERFWVSHIPIHPQELYGCRNIHGHLHHTRLDDERYINVGIDVMSGIPRQIGDIMNVGK